MKRNPILHWLIAMFTFGQYSFVWAYLIARDVNRVYGYECVEIKKSRNRFLIQYSIHMIGFVGMSIAFILGANDPNFRPSTLLFFALFINALTLMIFFIKKLTEIGEGVRDLAKTDSPSGVGIVVLSFVYMLSLPWIQSAMNKIEHIQSSDTTPASAPH